MANFIPPGARYMSPMVPPRIFRSADWPLLGLRLPGVMFWVVIPPASARANAGSPESSPSIARAWALIGTESSLLLAPVAGRFRTLKPVWGMGLDEPRNDAPPGGVEDLRLRRDGDVRAHRLDLPVADQHRAAGNRVRTHRVHQPAGDGDQVRVRLVPGSAGRRAEPESTESADAEDGRENRLPLRHPGRRLYQRPRRLGGVRFRFPGGCPGRVSGDAAQPPAAREGRGFGRASGRFGGWPGRDPSPRGRSGQGEDAGAASGSGPM